MCLFANSAVSNVFICKFMKTKAFLDNKHPKINRIIYHNIVLVFPANKPH